ncbi:hypothetical protein ACFLTB_03905 [Chloroflexota bacterium]
MYDNSCVFIGDGSLIAYARRNSIRLLRPGSEPSTIVSGFENIRFLTESYYGEYPAFWSDTGESFRLIDLSGEEIWSAWMNTDKAIPRGIQFSSFDNSFVCHFDFEGLPGLFFCDIDNGYTTTFGCSNSPIGYDAGLRYFVIDRVEASENEKYAFYIRDNSGNRVKLSADQVSRWNELHHVTVSRDRCLAPIRHHIPVRDWDAVVIKHALYGFFVLKDGKYHEIREPSPSGEFSMPGIFDEYANDRWYQRTFSAWSKFALVHSTSSYKATLVKCDLGATRWEFEDCSSALLRYLPYQRLVVRYNDGTVGVKLLSLVTPDTMEHKFAPPPGYETQAADIVRGWLTIAYTSTQSGALRIDRHEIPVY